MEKNRNPHGLSLSLLFVALALSSAGCIAIPYHPREITGSGGSGKTSQFKVLKGNAVTKDVVDKELAFKGQEGHLFRNDDTGRGI